MAVNERDIGTPEDPRIAAIYREASGEEPPSHLDTAVLRNARREVAAGTAQRRTPWWMPWRVPFAFAAVAVLSVSIVLVIEREGGEPMRLEAPSAAVPAPSVPVQAPPDAMPAMPPPPESIARSVEAGQNAATAADSQKRADTSLARPRTLAKQRAEEPAREPQAERSQAVENKVELQERALRDAAPADTATVQGRVASSAAPRERESAIAPAPPPPAAQAPPPLSQAPAAAPQAAPPTAAPAPAAKSAPAMAAQPAAEARPSMSPASKPFAAQRRAAPAVDAVGASAAALVAELEKKPPADWLARIALLRKDGRNAEADALVAEFKRRFPGEPLPPSVP
jgi:hypothetical protein